MYVSTYFRLYVTFPRNSDVLMRSEDKN